MREALYVGTLQHRRFLPKKHFFTYHVTYFYLDLEHPETVFNVPGVLSLDSWGVLSFRRKNYLTPEAVRERVRVVHGSEDVDKIFVLTHVSYFGFCFNPVSFYYCFDRSGNLRFIVSQVTNTPWGEKHIHSLSFTADQGRVALAKDFHVSPFMPMEIDYRWTFSAPRESLTIHMQNRPTGEETLLFDSTLLLDRRPATRGRVFTTFLRMPLMTMTTVFGIYWQAFILYFIKRVPFYNHPTKRPIS